MKPILFTLRAAEGLAERLCRDHGLEPGDVERRHFPDGESYVRLATPVAGRDVVMLCSLDRPDGTTLPLLFAGDAARGQGARRIGLVAPYLAYMRQDKAFRPGEAVTSRTYADLLSGRFDWLVTLDPHLHRYERLDSLYSIESAAATATGLIARWAADHVERPLFVGPDEESAQWVERIASEAGAPSVVLRKTRMGDREVRIVGPGLGGAGGRTPVIVDDIASSARTMIEAVRLLRGAGHPPPYCVAVHPIFAGDAYERLLATGPAAVVSTNAVSHPSNAIDVAPPIGAALDAMLGERD